MKIIENPPVARCVGLQTPLLFIIDTVYLSTINNLFTVTYCNLFINKFREICGPTLHVQLMVFVDILVPLSG